jgi:PadR family transcriptional regulator, regulatory protein PadR
MPSKSMTGASVQAIILSILSRSDSYGYEIIKKVSNLSGGEVEWAAGSLYPVMHRMEADGLITAYWSEQAGERKRRYYRITPKGLKALDHEKKEWLTVHSILVQLWGPQPSLT